MDFEFKNSAYRDLVQMYRYITRKVTTVQRKHFVTLSPLYKYIVRITDFLKNVIKGSCIVRTKVIKSDYLNLFSQRSAVSCHGSHMVFNLNALGSYKSCFSAEN